MANLSRITQKIFASLASNNGQFGSAQAGTKVTTTDVAVIQNLSAWLQGWNSATISAKKLPTLEEMQGIQYVVTRQLAYLFQKGIPEWDTGTEYYQFDIVRKTGTYELYGSLTNANAGNALPSKVDNSNWKYLGDLGSIPKSKYDATADPATSDDSTQGYTVGSIWVNVTKDTIFTCVDATASSAIWKQHIVVEAWVDVASAATTDLGAVSSDNIRITGTTTITSFGTAPAGTRKFIRFAGVLTLTHNATSLILPVGGANLNTAPNDSAIAISLGNGNWYVPTYMRNTGRPLELNFATQAQMEAGTDTFAVVTPSVMRYFPGVAKALCSFNDAPALFTAYNVTSISKTGTGRYVVGLGITFTDESYIVHANALRESSVAEIICSQGPTKTTTSYSINCYDATGNLIDASAVYLTFFGDT